MPLDKVLATFFEGVIEEYTLVKLRDMKAI
jgi:hypothetical protein